MDHDDVILASFIESFHKFDDMLAPGPIPSELDCGTDPQCDYQRWKPIALNTDVRALKDFYARIPGPLPALYEKLILTYRWLEVCLNEQLRLLANAPGPDLAELAGKMTVDPMFVRVLLPLGLIPFGKGGNYDPICFDLANRAGEEDCRILRVEHESVLCNGRVNETWVVSDSFRSLIASNIK